jgi:acyl-CoA dehydrogenase
MSWEFSTEPEFQEKLDWMETFFREEIEPLDLLWLEYDHAPPPAWLKTVVDPLKQQVKDRGLWACHLGPELGGEGFGQVKLALMNEILGRSSWGWGPTIFGVQGPDTGNAEIIAHYGTEEQKERYLQPLLSGEVFSAFSMTEPHGGSDPKVFTTRAVRDGDDWVINGDKFFTSNGNRAEFLIVMAVTDPEVSAYKGMSMFFVPADTPGIEIVRPTTYMGETPEVGQDHPHIRYNDVRVSADGLLGREGAAFEIAQIRLGGGRIHHAMRTVGVCNWAFEMMCERAVSRETQGSLLAEKQLVQQAIADSYAEIEQFRLFVLQTAWQIDEFGGTRNLRKEIATAKNLAAKVSHDVLRRAVHIHGALGVSDEMPLGKLWMQAPAMEVMDGPTEAHISTVSKQILRDQVPAAGLWPSEWLPARLEAARAKHADTLRAQAEAEGALAEAA